MYDLSNKAFLITGSTRGIGNAIARALAMAGATVGIHGRTPEKVKMACDQLSETGKRTVPVPGDFSEPEVAADTVRAFYKATGRLDGLINNAGIGKALSFRGMTLNKWRNTFSTNLEAAMIASREAYVIMREKGCGGIVNIASLAAHGPGKWMGADYAASKAGLVSITQSLAFEAAKFGIRVNAISPGMVETDMTSMLPEETKKSINIPLGRFAKPGEIADAVLFLLSDDSAYITGQVLHIDGGLWM
ncbi:MAG: SDR family oxidoreductase [Kiritimatiellae bacterium]|nr:SDR family oxidoreductase [Kiritimatiellia bacterium]MDD5520670.1 SDR family oxidoreductase [Kiritimatiellia bacterium]